MAVMSWRWCIRYQEQRRQQPVHLADGKAVVPSAQQMASTPCTLLCSPPASLKSAVTICAPAQGSSMQSNHA